MEIENSGLHLSSFFHAILIRQQASDKSYICEPVLYFSRTKNYVHERINGGLKSLQAKQQTIDFPCISLAIKPYPAAQFTTQHTRP